MVLFSSCVLGESRTYFSHNVVSHSKVGPRPKLIDNDVEVDPSANSCVPKERKNPGYADTHFLCHRAPFALIE